MRKGFGQNRPSDDGGVMEGNQQRLLSVFSAAVTFFLQRAHEGLQHQWQFVSVSSPRWRINENQWPLCSFQTHIIIIISISISIALHTIVYATYPLFIISYMYIVMHLSLHPYYQFSLLHRPSLSVATISIYFCTTCDVRSYKVDQLVPTPYLTSCGIVLFSINYAVVAIKIICITSYEIYISSCTWILYIYSWFYQILMMRSNWSMLIYNM